MIRFLLATQVAHALLACLSSVATEERTSSARSIRTQAERATGGDFAIERELIEGAIAAIGSSDYGAARTKAARAVELLTARGDVESDPAWLELLRRAGNTAWESQDPRTAKTAYERVLSVRGRSLPEEHPEVQSARQDLAGALARLGDLAGARALEERVLAVRSRTLSDDHADLQRARMNLATTLRELGDLRGARKLFEKVVEVRSRVHREDDRELHSARMNLGLSLKDLGDLEGARALLTEVLAAFSRMLPDDHPDLQAARQGLGATLRSLGDLSGARALYETVLAVQQRTLPDDHPSLQRARGNLALTMKDLGDLRGARALEEHVLALFLRSLPNEHPDVQRARLNLGGTLFRLGELNRAREHFEAVVAIRARTVPADHPELQSARINLAACLQDLGDLAAARALLEQVIAVQSRTLPDDHPSYQRARLNLAKLLSTLGDHAGARTLEEHILEVRSRSLPDDHPDLQLVRVNFAVRLKAVGELATARALEEQVLEVRSRTLPEDHPDLLDIQGNLALTLREQGEVEAARALLEHVLELRARTLGSDHPDLRTARANLALVLKDLGDLAGARTLEEMVLAAAERALPDEHPDLQDARLNLAVTLLLSCSRAGAPGIVAPPKDEGREHAVALLQTHGRAHARVASEVRLTRAGREAEERCASLATFLDFSISTALGFGGLDPLPELLTTAFTLSETTRNASVSTGILAREAARDPEYARLRESLRTASDTLAGLAQGGTTGDEYREARAARERAEQALLDAGRALSGDGMTCGAVDATRLARVLDPGVAAVAFRRFERANVDWRGAARETSPPTGTRVDSLCAFVVPARPHQEAAPRARPLLIDLGPIEPIRSAVKEWQQSLGIGSQRGLAVAPAARDAQRRAGTSLRLLAIDPVLAAVGDAHRIVVVLDDVLHLVPVDALPLGDAPPSGGTGGPRAQIVGDRWNIEVRATLGELLDAAAKAPTENTLLAVGEPAFNSRPLALDAEDQAGFEPAPTVDEPVARLLRGTNWERGFRPLKHSGEEARGIDALHEEIFGGEGQRILLEKRKASREALQVLSPRVRWLHVATHGWFAPESIAAWGDREPLDARLGLALRLSGAQQVRGMSPMLLCGLALAGANLPEDELGRVPGLLTADELSTLDLGNCELAVLSACETARGDLRRSGQGVASLQRALQVAGARSVITSLWKVPDEATMELMLDFYRRLWVEGQPKAQALAGAKRRLRLALDEDGDPKYAMYDWAAWVLTGAPE